MIPSRGAWVFDTGPMRHFAFQGWLGVLRFLADGREVYIPDSVERELRDASIDIPAIRAVLDEEWIRVFRTTEDEYQRHYARFHDRLVADGKNVGECGVLAMGAAYGCELVIDDSVPRKIAEEMGLNVTATVPILCDAIRAKKLTTVMVESLADDLLSGKYYLPFGKGGFRQHVLENGMLDWEDVK